MAISNVLVLVFNGSVFGPVRQEVRDNAIVATPIVLIVLL
jgi:hypothetical protein